MCEIVAREEKTVGKRWFHVLKSECRSFHVCKSVFLTGRVMPVADVPEGRMVDGSVVVRSRLVQHPRHVVPRPCMDSCHEIGINIAQSHDIGILYVRKIV